jgi:hypothetical protein
MAEIKYLEVVGSEGECAKHGKDWIFKKKNDPPPEDPVFIVIPASEYTHYCVACLLENHQKPAEPELVAKVPATIGRIDNAVRRALNVFDRWNNVTGFVEEHCGYYYELQGVIEDAVHCGVQAMLDVKEPLPNDEEESDE